MYEYTTHGTCSTKVSFDIIEGKVHNVLFENGCNGNLKAIGSLVEGLPASDVIGRLRGIECGRKGTSCGDQLAQAVAAAVADIAVKEVAAS